MARLRLRVLLLFLLRSEVHLPELPSAHRRAGRGRRREVLGGENGLVTWAQGAARGSAARPPRRRRSPDEGDGRPARRGRRGLKPGSGWLLARDWPFARCGAAGTPSRAPDPGPWRRLGVARAGAAGGDAALSLPRQVTGTLGPCGVAPTCSPRRCPGREAPAALPA